MALENQPNIITVIFSNPSLDEERFIANSIDIDEDTKEILSIFLHSNLEEYKGEPDKDKIKKSIINLFNRINIKVDEKSILDQYDIDYLSQK